MLGTRRSAWAEIRTARSSCLSKSGWKEALRTAKLKLEQVKAGPAAADVAQAQTAVETAQASHRAAVARLDGRLTGTRNQP